MVRVFEGLIDHPLVFPELDLGAISNLREYFLEEIIQEIVDIPTADTMSCCILFGVHQSTKLSYFAFTSSFHRHVSPWLYLHHHLKQAIVVFAKVPNTMTSLFLWQYDLIPFHKVKFMLFTVSFP